MPSILFKRKASPRPAPSRKPAPVWHPDVEMPTPSGPQTSATQYKCYAALCEASNCPYHDDKKSVSPLKRKPSLPTIELALPPFPTLRRLTKPVRLLATPAMQRSTSVGSVSSTSSFGSFLSLSSGEGSSSSSSVELPIKRSFPLPPKIESTTKFFQSKGKNVHGFKQLPRVVVTSPRKT